MSASPTTRVQVQTVGGEVLELVVKSHSLIRGLKQKIEQQWQVPFDAQKLVCDTTILKNADSIASLLKHSSAQEVLCITLVKALDSLYQSLTDEKETAEKKISSMQKLAEMAPKEDEDAIKAIFCLLKDSSSEVRRAVIEALVKVGGRDNKRVISELCECAESTNEAVKLAAIAGLPQTARKGNAHVVNTILKRLKDESAAVRRLALFTLPQAAALDDDRVIAALIEELLTVDLGVPISAEMVLPQLVSKGNRFVINRMIEILQESQLRTQVRRRALYVICDVAKPDDDIVTTTILDACTHAIDHIAMVAIEKLPLLMQKGDKRAITMLKEIVSEHENGNVRRAAGQSLQSLQSG